MRIATETRPRPRSGVFAARKQVMLRYTAIPYQLLGPNQGMELSLVYVLA